MKYLLILTCLISTFNITVTAQDTIQATRLDYLDCGLWKHGGGRYVIINEQQYKELIDHSTCSRLNFPSINFEENILIVYGYMSGGCGVKVSNEIIEKQGEYVITITVEKIGLCKLGNVIREWLLVPVTTAEPIVKLDIKHTYTKINK